MQLCKVKLPKVRKTLILDSALATTAMSNLTKALDKFKYADIQDYQCIPSIVSDYLDEMPEPKYNKPTNADISVAALVILNNAPIRFSNEERDELTSSFYEEGIEINYCDKNGWIPLLEDGYDYFLVVDTIN